MPCNDGYNDRGRVEYRDDPETKRRLDNVTRLLCSVMRNLEGTTNTFSTVVARVPGLGAWWADHKEADARREAAEKKAEIRRAKKKAALAKLTKEEKDILGL